MRRTRPSSSMFISITRKSTEERYAGMHGSSPDFGLSVARLSKIMQIYEAGMTFVIGRWTLVMCMQPSLCDLRVSSQFLLSRLQRSGTGFSDVEQRPSVFTTMLTSDTIRSVKWQKNAALSPP